MEMVETTSSKYFRLPVICITLGRTLLSMLSVQPILHHLIAIGLAYSALGLLSIHWFFPAALDKYLVYAPYLVYGLIFYQVIRAATRSLFISCLLLVLSGLGFFLHHIAPELQLVSITDLQYGMTVGISGLMISLFAIR